jgi:hypothetical protein
MMSMNFEGREGIDDDFEEICGLPGLFRRLPVTISDCCTDKSKPASSKFNRKP